MMEEMERALNATDQFLDAVLKVNNLLFINSLKFYAPSRIDFEPFHKFSYANFIYIRYIHHNQISCHPDRRD